MVVCTSLKSLDHLSSLPTPHCSNQAYKDLTDISVADWPNLDFNDHIQCSNSRAPTAPTTPDLEEGNRVLKGKSQHQGRLTPKAGRLAGESWRLWAPWIRCLWTNSSAEGSAQKWSAVFSLVYSSAHGPTENGGGEIEKGIQSTLPLPETKHMLFFFATKTHQTDDRLSPQPN